MFLTIHYSMKNCFASSASQGLEPKRTDISVLRCRKHCSISLFGILVSVRRTNIFLEPKNKYVLWQPEPLFSFFWFRYRTNICILHSIGFVTKRKITNLRKKYTTCFLFRKSGVVKKLYDYEKSKLCGVFVWFLTIFRNHFVTLFCTTCWI